MDRHSDWPPAERGAVRPRPPSRVGTLFPPCIAALKRHTHTQKDSVNVLQRQQSTLLAEELNVSPSNRREFSHCPDRCSCAPVSDSAQPESTGSGSGRRADWRPGEEPSSGRENLWAAYPETTTAASSPSSGIRPVPKAGCRAGGELLLHRCWICRPPAVPSRRNPRWKKCASQFLGFFFIIIILFFFTADQWPVSFHCTGSPIWVCSLQPRRLFPITAEITTAVFTIRPRPACRVIKKKEPGKAFTVLPAVSSINLYRFTIVWPFSANNVFAGVCVLFFFPPDVAANSKMHKVPQRKDA